ncbi:MAG TPA: DNA polymerase III subunit delta [Dermatophilaceae bacterium]|nr:DNA polymerase III subunit delta [Dermatophilaceae bacterium]
MVLAPPASSGVPALVLVLGPEDLLADRALAATLDALQDATPGLDVIRVDAVGYLPGDLAHLVTPSLFGGTKAVVVTRADEAGDALTTDLLAVIATPEPEVTLVVKHRGGNRARKVVEAMRKAQARVIDVPAVKSDRDKSDFVVNEFRRVGRKIAPEAVRAMVEALGRDLAELAAGCAQLIEDSSGLVTETLVATYQGGRVEATGFRVADAALAGDRAEALRLVRHALAGGLDPVPIVAVLASQLRQLVRVGGAGRGASAQVASSLGLAPWQVDRARRALTGWEVDGLATAIQAVAEADFEVKGGGRDPVYALERALLTVTGARQPR